MDKIFQHIPLSKVRIAAGFAVMVAILNWLRPAHFPDVLDSVLILSTLCGWLYAELSGTVPTSHDIKLLDNITSSLPDSLLDFLRDQNFVEKVFQDTTMSGLHTLGARRGPSYTFDDPKIQKKWATLHGIVKQFSENYARNVFHVGASSDLWTVHPKQSDTDEPSPLAQERGNSLNIAATELIGEIEKFKIYARRRL